MYERAVILNELAQGLRPMADGIRWFEGLADEDQRRTLRELDHFCRQARAARLAGPKPTYTPCRATGCRHEWHHLVACRPGGARSAV